MWLFTNMGLNSINEYPQSLPVTVSLYVWLALKQLIYFVVEIEYSALIVLNLDKLHRYIYCKLQNGIK